MAINQCCGLFYTSGTTGPPKGVMMSHDNLTWTAKMVTEYLSVGKTDRLVSYLPLSHSAAQMAEVWVPLTAAATLYFANKNALKGSLVQTLREVQPTIFLGVPRVFEKIQEKMQEVGKNGSVMRQAIASWAKKTGLEHNLKAIEENGEETSFSFELAKWLIFSKVKQQLGFEKAKSIGVGAAPLSKETLDYFLSLDIPIYEAYGMSETSGAHTGQRKGQQKLGSVGQSVGDFQTKIFDPDTDVNGEICMNSRNIMMGYLNNPKATKDVIDNDGWLHSGDIGCEVDSGFFKVTGRIKELIITSGGENVPPVLIEDTIKRFLPCVSNALIVGDQKKFLSCILTLKVEFDVETQQPTSELTLASKDWCLKQGIKATTVDEILDGPDFPKLAKAIQDGMDLVNQQATSNAQRIQKFVVVPTDFSLPGGELGPTMKVKRQFVLKKYESLIDNMYN